MKAFTLALLSLTLVACSKQPPLKLISPEEAGQPASRGAITIHNDGPTITIFNPLTDGEIASPFPIHIEFRPREANSAVDMQTLKLTYKKLWGIDITDRVRGYIDGTSITVPETEMPEGRHTIEIYIEDSDNNVSTKQITVNVLANH